ncbi:GntR family transcriptional regulator [Verrucomicrobiaceae bacterium R5-34]|uniref:GntR family transcriptional regulator n=1 Tax=Oceaniferula flava TaxID=2800421 RepID=A0AAE2VEZ5_9BACT|nr:GntR family transcriptional regulator [Oceaniferula flavus]MBK1829786.1 GntR family transcriptional regulator [Verrucomicrobiaceae bacterium R5-34]MBK1856409.1 GntR family transcriptional regulator [Oceaniferula flavus]MBM1137716.1 GntR family transcriptional regulator [Oceaniferula flavus]
MSDSKPRYLQIYDEILLKIRERKYLPGDLLPTESEMCKQYNVSRPTIAKALKMLSDERLVKRKAGFGTQVMAPGKSKQKVGFLIPRLQETEIFEPICISIAEMAAEAGVKMMLPAEVTASDDLKVQTEAMAKQLIEAKVNGVFFAPAEHVVEPQAFNHMILKRLKDHGIHVVLLDRDIFRWPRQTRCDLIGIDNIEAGYVVATHLLEGGCQRLAFVTRGNPAMTVQLRRMGCREALVQKGLLATSLYTLDYHTAEPGESIDEMLENGVDGIICANDSTAATLMRNLLDRNVDIPGRVKVCGFDDVKYASLLSVPLTSYQQPCKEIGKVAADIMINRIKHPETPIKRVTIQGQLIERASSVSPTS